VGLGIAAVSRAGGFSAAGNSSGAGYSRAGGLLELVGLMAMLIAMKIDIPDGAISSLSSVLGLDGDQLPAADIVVVITRIIVVVVVVVAVEPVPTAHYTAVDEIGGFFACLKFEFKF